MISLSERKKSGSERILVVDDDGGVRENLAELFETVGYAVESASNAAEAMEKIAAGEFDLLLTDYRMPGMNGVEFIERVRELRPTLKAVLMTAFGDSFTEIESVRRGAIGYLTKPFEAEDVIRLVEQILALRRE